ncbi:MAG TPA: DNA alkylation repair protein [Dehalococcoidia bacterium]
MVDYFSAYHDEVVAALTQHGNPRYGAAVAADRRSSLEYLGVSAPEQRAVVKKGFSFYRLPATEVLAVWDALWRQSPYGEVLFCAFEYYGPRLKKAPEPAVWPVMRDWIGRVDNWAHADGLAGLYSRLLEASPGEVYPQLDRWNAENGEWQRRISLVSLIHYTGKNAVFLPPDKVLPMVSNCLDDRRYYVEKGLGWVLREMGLVYPAQITAYIEANIGVLGSTAFARAIERSSPEERARLRALRRRAHRRDVGRPVISSSDDDSAGPVLA